MCGALPAPTQKGAATAKLWVAPEVRVGCTVEMAREAARQGDMTGRCKCLRGWLHRKASRLLEESPGD